MTTSMEQAKAFLEKAATMTKEALQEGLGTLTDEVKSRYWELRKAAFFTPENAKLDRRYEVLSPSGKYKLVVTPFSTTEGAWNYAQGLVYAMDSDKPIAEIQRNYGSFPHLFIEDHLNGHPYLVAGADYQGSTVIELDTGNRRDFLPEEAKKGHGFCWAAHEFNAEHSLLIVDGCFWACPYEYKIYDFSDPMRGWPELEADHTMDASDKMPTIEADGTIKAYELEYLTDSDHDESDAEEEARKKARAVTAIQTFRRDGNKLIRIDEWVSDAERARRDAQAEGMRKHEAWLLEFKSTDPLYLTYLEQLKDPKLSPEPSQSYGITHENWCPDFHEKETRWCRRIIWDKLKLTVDLEWGVVKGPIKIQVYRDGKHTEDKFFEHSVEAMQAAFEYAKELLNG